jgi:hypothetical protein
MTREINWFATQAGQSLLAQAMKQAEPILWPLCGHNALLLQPDERAGAVPRLQCAPVTRLYRRGSLLAGDFIADDRFMPLSSDCISLVYAAFVLESSASPERLIAESERLLVSEGHLGLLALNPFGIHRLSGDWRGLSLRTRQQWSDCLQQAGFEVIRHESLGPLWAGPQIKTSSPFFPRPRALRSVNFLLAKKRKAALTPIRKTANTVALARESTHA